LDIRQLVFATARKVSKLRPLAKSSIRSLSLASFEMTTDLGTLGGLPTRDVRFQAGRRSNSTPNALRGAATGDFNVTVRFDVDETQTSPTAEIDSPPVSHNFLTKAIAYFSSGVSWRALGRVDPLEGKSEDWTLRELQLHAILIA
jgi:hypothetical protein